MIGFHAIKVRGDSTVANLNTTPTNDWVWLPVPPDGLSTTYSQGWGEASQGLIPSAVQAGIKISEIAGMFGGDAKKGSGGGGVPGSGNEGILVTSAVSGLIDLGSEKLKEAGGFGVGITMRALEQSYISYSGPGYRSFSFTFALRPESSADSDEIDKIVKFFKFYSAPVLGDTAGVARVYDVPHLFHIEVLPNDGLFKFKRCALKTVGVKYGGEKYNTFTKGNRPTQTDISLEFQEMQLLSQKDFGDH
jgi:hypothetical protein